MQRLHWTFIFILSVQFVIKKKKEKKKRCLLSVVNVITRLH